MSRIKERRISRRMASKGGPELVPKSQVQSQSMQLPPTAPTNRPTSGLEDLDSLMSELGAGGSGIRTNTPPGSTVSAPSKAPASPVVKPAPAPVSKPAPTTAPKQNFDDIDNLMAALSLTTPQQTQPRQSQPQPIRQAPAPVQGFEFVFLDNTKNLKFDAAKPPPGDPLLGDIDALMASLGPTQPAQAPRPQQPSRASNPPYVAPGTQHPNNNQFSDIFVFRSSYKPSGMLFFLQMIMIDNLHPFETGS